MLKNQFVFDINKLVRKNILNMKPYASARDEFKGRADIYLDANESPFPTPYNRYPDPLQVALKEEIVKGKGITVSQLFLGNGSDEAIDLLIRVFCEPNLDSILIAEPTYGMYSVCAEINNVNIQRTSLTEMFDLDLDALFTKIDSSTKLIFICSPNNPSGNLLSREKIETIITRFNGLVVIDEAYIDFANSKSFTEELKTYSNIVVLQTFSKAWGLAGLRLGMCYASSEIISMLNKIKYPYNVNSQTQKLALEALANREALKTSVNNITAEREKLIRELSLLASVQRIVPSDSNFLLVKFLKANYIYETLMKRGIILRNRSNVKLCEDCIRITVGTSNENQQLLKALKEI